MDKKKIIKCFMVILFVLYIFLFFASESGYYEYNVRKRTLMTNEKIKEFEEDIKNNENIDLENYLESTHKIYKNKLTNTCSSVSENVNLYVLSKLKEVSDR